MLRLSTFALKFKTINSHDRIYYLKICYLKPPMLPPCRIMKRAKSAYLNFLRGHHYVFSLKAIETLGEILHLPTWQGSHPLSTYLTSPIVLPGTWPKWREEEKYVWNHVFNVPQAIKPYGFPSLRWQGLYYVVQVTSHTISPAQASLDPLAVSTYGGRLTCLVEVMFWDETISFS